MQFEEKIAADVELAIHRQFAQYAVGADRMKAQIGQAAFQAGQRQTVEQIVCNWLAADLLAQMGKHAHFAQKS